MQDVEEERGQRERVRGCVVTAEATHRVLEPAGQRVLGNPDGFTVEHELLTRERARDRDDLRHALRHVVQVAREHAHLLAAPVHLDARAVELPFHRGGSRRGERFADRRRARGEHRLHRPEHLQPDFGQRIHTTHERALRSGGEVAAEHGGAANGVGRDVGGAGDRVGHQPGQRALAELTGEQAHHEIGFRGGRTIEEPAQDRLPPCSRSRAARGFDLVERVIELGDRHGRLGHGSLLVAHGRQRRPADPDPALARLTRQQADDRRDLVVRALAQHRRERVDLRLARTFRAHGP